MKKTFLFIAAIICATMVNAEVITTSVYSNNFVTATSTKLDSVEMGTPAVLFTNKQVAIVGTTAPVPATNENFLQIQNRKATGGVKGQNMVMAPIANFAAPFAAKLSEIQADSVVWMFNFRNNNQYASKGFDDGMMGYANVLVADNNDLQDGNGYAVIMGRMSGDKGDKKIHLVKYTNGLDANDNITSLIASPECTLRKYWTIRVAYLPSTNTWKMAWYEDLDAFVAPAEVTAWTDCGSIVDATYTNNEMTTFGFLNNYSGNNDGIMYVMNYDVVAYTTGGTTSMETIRNANAIHKVVRNGQLVIEKHGIHYNALGIQF